MEYPFFCTEFCTECNVFNWFINGFTFISTPFMIKYILGYLLVLSFGNIILMSDNFNILIDTLFVNTRVFETNKKGILKNYRIDKPTKRVLEKYNI